MAFKPTMQTSNKKNLFWVQLTDNFLFLCAKLQFMFPQKLKHFGFHIKSRVSIKNNMCLWDINEC